MIARGTTVITNDAALPGRRLPLTSIRRVGLLITALAVIRLADPGFPRENLCPGVWSEQIRAQTGAALIIADNLHDIALA